ncbi:MAG TPA: efflux RND transporter periplasmic adaptor subunit [Methylococcus sp.]|nr:efflux RND transporter periplasmic adaptor subunit [Methylococcus sp.]
MRSAVPLAVVSALVVGIGLGFWLGRGRQSPPRSGPLPAAQQTPPPPAKEERKILYYRNPMGLPDTSPVPKKDAMGMDYIPVYADEEASVEGPIVHVSTEKIQRLGVKTEPVRYAEIAQTVRSVGVVEADERRLHDVTLRFDGYVERLYVNTTGQAVTRGQPLFELYSPDLLATQREYLSARNAQSALSSREAGIHSGMKDLAASSLERLRLWGIAESDLTLLEQRGQVLHTLIVRSPTSGVVLEKTVVAGRRVVAGDVLFKIADLSTVWILAQVYEQDIGRIEPGQTVRATLDAYPGRVFDGKVGFLYPTLDPETRTARVRIELPNPRCLLKPMMYAHVAIDTQAHRTLTVPRSAVLETGRRTLVLVERGEGRFEPRPVRLGLRGEEMVEILQGLREGERVVVSANFLIDAESNLKTAIGSFGPAGSSVEGGISSGPPPANGHADHGEE